MRRGCGRRVFYRASDEAVAPALSALERCDYRRAEHAESTVVLELVLCHALQVLGCECRVEADACIRSLSAETNRRSP